MTSRSTTRQGPSGRRSRRKSRMRSVILGISPSLAVETAGPFVSESRCGDGQFRDEAARFAGLWPAGFPVGSREADGAVRSFAAFAWNGEFPDPHARQDVDASSVTPGDGDPAETKKARYVVALSRVLRSTRGASPAVRPRTVCDHRHVRIWASREVGPNRFRFKNFSWPAAKKCRVREAKRAHALR